MNTAQSERGGPSGFSTGLPTATGVNPFTGAPVAAATEHTSLSTAEKSIYTPGI